MEPVEHANANSVGLSESNAYPNTSTNSPTDNAPDCRTDHISNALGGSDSIPYTSTDIATYHGADASTDATTYRGADYGCAIANSDPFPVAVADPLTHADNRGRTCAQNARPPTNFKAQARNR